MNANELADEWDDHRFWEIKHYSSWCDEAQKMIRKQAEEVEYWKEKFEKAMELNK
jgi:hypothetical protein